MSNVFHDAKAKKQVATDNLKNDHVQGISVSTQITVPAKKKPHPLITIQKTQRDKSVVKSFEKVTTPQSLTDQLLFEITKGDWATLDIMKQWANRIPSPLPIDPDSLRSLVASALSDKLDAREINEIVKDVIIAITTDEVNRLDERFTTILTKVIVPLLKQRMPKMAKIEGSIEHTISGKAAASEALYDKVLETNPQLLDEIVIQLEDEYSKSNSENID